MQLSSLLLAPVVTTKPLAPTPGAFGNALVDVYPYGESPEAAAGIVPPQYYTPAEPRVYCLKYKPSNGGLAGASATLLAGCQPEIGNNDNTAGYVLIKRSTDKGVTWSTSVAVAVISPRYSGGGNGSANATNTWDVLQRSDGTILLVYMVTKWGNNTGGRWYDFNGNSLAETLAVKIYALKSVDDGVTWTDLSGTVSTVGTDVTSHFTGGTDKRNQLSISAIAPTAGNAAFEITTSSGPTDAPFLISDAISAWSNDGTDYTFTLAQDDLCTGMYVLFSGVTDSGGSALNNTIHIITRTSASHYTLTGAGKTGSPSGGTAKAGGFCWLQLSGMGSALLNYSSVGALYAQFVDATHLVIIGVSAAGGTPTLSTAVGLPQFGWFALGGPGCVQPVGWTNGDKFTIPIYQRYGLNSVGQPKTGLVVTDLTTWTVSTQDTSLSTLGSVETTCAPLPTMNHILCDAREGTGSTRVQQISTDGGATLGVEAANGVSVGGTQGSLISLGGNKLLFVCTGQAVGRQCGSAWIFTIGAADAITISTQRRINAGVSGYSGATVLADGTIVVHITHDSLDNPIGGATGIGRVKQVKLNATAILSGNDPPIVLPFNDLGSGQTAWTNLIGFRDVGNAHGCLGAHAQVKGNWTFQAGGGATADTTGYAILAAAANNDYTYAPNGLPSDSANFLYAIEFTIASSGAGVVASHGGSGVGSGTAGWKVLIPANNIQVTLDDGTNHLVSTNVGAVPNDGGRYRVVMSYTAATSTVKTQIYNAATGVLMGTEIDTAGTALGSIANVTQATTLLRYGDTNTGRMNQACTVYLSMFSRNLNEPLPPMPYVPPAADAFAAAPANSPGDTSLIPSANLKFWLDLTAGYALQGLSGEGHAPDPPPVNWPACMFIERSQGYFTTSGFQGNVVSDAVMGTVFRFGEQAAITFDARTINAFTNLVELNGAFTLAMAVEVPAGVASTQAEILGNLDGSGNGFAVYSGRQSQASFGFLAMAGGTSFDFYAGSALSNLYTAGQQYGLVITFTGTAGAGASGFVSYLCPLNGLTTAASIAATGVNNASPSARAGNANGVGTTDSLAALAIGGTALGDIVKSAFITNTVLSEANIVALLNGPGFVSPLTGHGAIVANFTTDKTYVAAGGTVNFTNTSTGTVSATTYLFGDGAVSTATNPAHVYANPGIYDVTIIAGNADGSNTVTKSQLIYVGSVAAYNSAIANLFKNTGGSTPVASDGDVIQYITDLSGNSKQLVKDAGATTDAIYKANQVNSLGSIRMTSGALLTSTANIAQSQPFTVFAVFNQTAWTQHKQFFDSAGGDYPLVRQETTTPGINSYFGGPSDGNAALNTWHVVQFFFNAASSTITVDDNSATALAGAAGTAMSGVFHLGSEFVAPNDTPNFDIAELLVFGSLTAGQAAQIQEALETKYVL